MWIQLQISEVDAGAGYVSIYHDGTGLQANELLAASVLGDSFGPFAHGVL